MHLTIFTMGARRQQKLFLFPENGIEWFDSTKDAAPLSDTRINLAQLHRMVVKALCAHGNEADNAVARALVAGEADGLLVHGISRLASYCSQVASGKINGYVVPTVRQVADASSLSMPITDLPIRRFVWL